MRLHSWLVPSAFALMLVLLGLAGSWALPAPSAAAPAAAPAVTCTPAWDPVPAAAAPAESFLYSLAPVAANDIWAAGKAWVYPADPLVEHWDGAAWSAVPFPTVVPGHDHILHGVAAVSAGDVWAAGDYADAAYARRTLLGHWTGSAWSVVPSPNAGGDNYLNGIAAGPGDLWAVGETVDANSHHQALILHSTGAAWTVAAAAQAGTSDNTLTAVTRLSGTDAWAVGYYRDSATGNIRPLLEHWNGAAWSVVAPPDTGSTRSYLRAIAPASATDIWAVGDSEVGLPLALHWNGVVWSAVPTPTPPYAHLTGVAAVASDNVWAAGYYGPGGEGFKTVLLHWDGSAWTVVPSPNNGPYENDLYAIAALGPADIWAAGQYCEGNCAPRALIAHYSGHCEPTPTPTATVTPIPCGVGQWTTRTPYPVSVEGASGGALGGALYSFGGYTAGGAATSIAFKYAPSTDTWSPIARLPAGRYNGGAASDGTYFYLLGGIAGTARTNTLYRYDPTTDSYTTLAPAPHAASGFALVYLAGKLYRIGGYINDSHSATVDVYTIATNTWAPGPSYPEATVLLTALADGHYIYAGGGNGEHGPDVDKTYRFDPATGTWDDAAVADLPQAREGAVSALLNGRWLVVGGYLYPPAMDGSGVALDLAHPAGAWTPLPAMPAPRCCAVGGVLGTTLHVVSGQADAGGGTPDHQVYDEQPCGPGATPSPTPVCALTFTDVPMGSTFYDFVRCLTCRQIVGGYSDGTFRPGAEVTRGQLAKFVANAAGYTDAVPATRQTFSDVPPSHPFWLYIERVAAHGVVGGYSDGTFQPGANVTRGQVAKFVSNAAGYIDTIPAIQQTFSDVPWADPFWTFIERVAEHGVVAGYSDGSFHPTASVTRGQTAKFISNAFFPNCQTP